MTSSLLTEVAAAVADGIAVADPALTGADPLVRPSERADFQSGAALALARRAGRAPAELADRVAEAVRTDLLAGVRVSGPGFLELTVAAPAVWRRVAARLARDDLGVPRAEAGRRVVIDYSAPNIAKELHVGHLRSTIIGDCLARVLGRLGDDVVRQNHLGDWGTQFGMLIQYLDEHPEAAWRHGDLAALDQLYREARARFDADEAFAGRSRSRVVALQSGDPETIAVWREIVAASEAAFRRLYDRLDVLLTPADSAGESFYNDRLAGVVDELTRAGVAVESDGAVVVLSATETGPDGAPVPLILRKRDGGYGYDTTDLATLRYRVGELCAGRVLYVVDARQALHFRLVVEAARRAGWLPGDVEVAHVSFGTVLGPDGRPFRTRAGDTVTLGSLLDAAVERARAVVAAKNPSLDPAAADRVAELTGIGAVKYAELSTSRTKDYTFDVGRMVSFTGNTGGYLQYAHARIAAILRRAEGEADPVVDPTTDLHPAERALGLALDAFGDTLADVAATLEPHRLCTYLYDTARAFTDFYEACPVLTAPEPSRGNRLALCRLTKATLREGLALLGIAAPERM
ncbi:arginine--tRNA ligase [Jiangella sp. DSM 45060]|uniref:arginine--tRNA ligase n=1 Tax=Jiangella sp. DSM 45060 TaxID=1798224 RepID=UPI00087DAC76|nr:arginine--tRNA ligase [Jiangella sp. DSM 45060]SDT63076.1 arginyl-tRNA synthetase [Jiangella sp. DSM 45060]